MLSHNYLSPYVSNRRVSFPLDSFLDEVAAFGGFNSLFNLIDQSSQLVEKDGVYSQTIDLAGFKKEEVKVEVVDGLVTVTAENKRRGKVVRRVYLSDVDADKIEAVLEDGELKLSLPRYPEALPKRIEVK